MYCQKGFSPQYKVLGPLGHVFLECLFRYNVLSSLAPIELATLAASMPVQCGPPRLHLQPLCAISSGTYIVGFLP